MPSQHQVSAPAGLETRAVLTAGRLRARLPRPGPFRSRRPWPSSAVRDPLPRHLPSRRTAPAAYAILVPSYAGDVVALPGRTQVAQGKCYSHTDLRRWRNRMARLHADCAGGTARRDSRRSLRRPAGAGRSGGGVRRPPPAAPRLSRGGGGGGGAAAEHTRRDVAAVGVRGPAGPGAGLPVRAGPRAAPRGPAAALSLAAGHAASRPLAGGAHGGGLAGGHCPARARLGARRRRVGAGSARGAPLAEGRGARLGRDVHPGVHV